MYFILEEKSYIYHIRVISLSRDLFICLTAHWLMFLVRFNYIHKLKARELQASNPLDYFQLFSISHMPQNAHILEKSSMTCSLSSLDTHTYNTSLLPHCVDFLLHLLHSLMCTKSRRKLSLFKTPFLYNCLRGFKALSSYQLLAAIIK